MQTKFKNSKNQRSYQNYQAKENKNYELEEKRKKLSKLLGKGRQISQKYPDVSVTRGDRKFLNRWHRDYTRKDLIFVTKGKSYYPIWLEEGNEGSGFKHIKKDKKKGQNHVKDFYSEFGIYENNIPSFLKKTIKDGKVIYYKKRMSDDGNKKIGYDVYYKYQEKKLMIGIGNNGYIVTAFPKQDKKGEKKHETRNNRK